MENIKINYGTLRDGFEEQLNKQGYTLADEQEKFEKLSQSLTMCMFHLMTEKQYQSCLKSYTIS